MKNNLELVSDIVDYIEENLENELSIEFLSNYFSYSKYHLQRIFSSIVGFPMHAYIQRRRLSEASRLLVYSDISIIEIALLSGYNTQQSFHYAFTSLFKCSPHSFRKKKVFFPIQLKYKVDNNKLLRGDEIMDIHFVEDYSLKLIGYSKSTKWGFHVIGQCMRKIDKERKNVENQINLEVLIGLNDYTKMSYEDKHPSFDFFGGVEVSSITPCPKGMIAKEFISSKYIVFTFKGRKEDSMEPISNYIYKEWFPQSTCKFNEQAKFDFTKSNNKVDKDGKNTIEYWVPIL